MGGLRMGFANEFITNNHGIIAGRAANPGDINCWISLGDSQTTCSYTMTQQEWSMVKHQPWLTRIKDGGTALRALQYQ